MTEEQSSGVPDGWSVVPDVRSAQTSAQTTPTTSSALELAAAGAAVPIAAHAAMEVATSPNAAKAGSAIGQIIGGVDGALKAGPMGAAGGAWTGGKAGWFTGKLAQKLAAPIAGVAEKIAPYAQTLSTLSGAQGIADLAQMAEPNRKDIGFLGIGPSVPDLEVLQKAVAHGANPGQAAAQIVNGDPQRFGALMTTYMKSRQVLPSSSSLSDYTKPDPNDPSWKRADGSMKGNGFLGVIQRPDGKVSSEISIGVNIGGKEVEIPTLVPTLSQSERDWLINNDVSDPSRIPQSIIQKATLFARSRIAMGKSPFAQSGEGVK